MRTLGLVLWLADLRRGSDYPISLGQRENEGAPVLAKIAPNGAGLAFSLLWPGFEVAWRFNAKTGELVKLSALRTAAGCLLLFEPRLGASQKVVLTLSSVETTPTRFD